MLHRDKDGGAGMTISWFLTVRHPAASLDAATLDGIAGTIRGVSGLAAALMFTPAGANDPYLDDGRPPILALQLDFPAIEPLEAALVPAGALQGIPALLRAAADGAAMEEQAMLARAFPVPDPAFRTAPGRSPGTYLVAYDGAAADLNAWLTYYIAHHPPIMARFLGIRQISIFTRIDWCSAFPAFRGNAFQRNKVVFDDAESLDAALNSPVRHEMRADFHKFPPFEGRNTHYAMHTRTIPV
ncbi:MAG TPA: hypothetical protein VHS58_14995 [Acetobacteraceae bacterium]|jgi:hypothetical protein|nr:hypothetical protein [Acetobacteraceae bacterium]